MDALMNIGTMFLVAAAGLAGVYAAFRVFNRWVFPKVDFQRHLAEGNIAVAIFVAALVLGMFLFMGRALGGELDRYDSQFRKWGRYHFGYSYDWRYFKAQGMTESGLKADVCSHVGACGLMQFMPGTARGMGLTDRFNAKASIRQGIRYDRRLWRQFSAPRPTWDRMAFAFMSYNAGLGNVLKFQRAAVADGVDPNLFVTLAPYIWTEPREYVERIARWCQRFGGWKCHALRRDSGQAKPQRRGGWWKWNG